jgi:hypothetical protein
MNLGKLLLEGTILAFESVAAIVAAAVALSWWM